MTDGQVLGTVVVLVVAVICGVIAWDCERSRAHERHMANLGYRQRKTVHPSAWTETTEWTKEKP